MVFNLKFKTINKDVFSVEFVFFFLVIVQVYKLINKMKNEDSDASDSDYIVNENKKSKVRYSQGYIEKGTEEYKDGVHGEFQRTYPESVSEFQTSG